MIDFDDADSTLPTERTEDVEVMYPRCAGLDVHKRLIVACVRLIEAGRIVRQKERFGTTTAELTRLAAWMTAHNVTHAAMESTGVYWKPVWHVLERDFQLILANAQHVKAVPGRKSDMSDAEWLAELLAHGLMRSSFVPPEGTQELRELTRTRKQMSRALAKQALRIQKVLEDANVKLSSVVSDILGKASRAILDANHRRRDRSRSLGPTQGPTESDASRTGGGASWPCDGESPVSASTPSGSGRFDPAGDRGHRSEA